LTESLLPAAYDTPAKAAKRAGDSRPIDHIRRDLVASTAQACIASFTITSAARRR
jgi:hypothetical protein